MSGNGDRPELLEGWAWKRLGDIGDYHNGRAFKEAEWSETGRPIIRIQNLTDASKPFNRFQGEVEERHRVADGDLLVSWAATLDVFVWRGEDAVLNQHIFKVRSAIDPRYHYWVLKSVLPKIRGQAHGSGMVHVTRKKFDDTLVPVPPVDMQRATATQLDSVVGEIEQGAVLLREADARFEDFSAATLEAVCLGTLLGEPAESVNGPSDVPPLPPGWEWVELESLAADEPRAITDGPFGSNLKTSHYTEAGPRVIRLQNVGEGEFKDAEAHISPEHFETLRAHEARAGDIVMASLGEGLPRACVVPGGLGPAIVKADCPRMRVAAEVNAEFLAACLNSRPVRRQAEVFVHGTGRPRLKLADARKLKVPKAPRVEQDALVGRMRELRDARVALERARDDALLKSEAVRRAALRDAMTGQLAVLSENSA